MNKKFLSVAAILASMALVGCGETPAASSGAASSAAPSSSTAPAASSTGADSSEEASSTEEQSSSVAKEIAISYHSYARNNSFAESAPVSAKEGETVEFVVNDEYETGAASLYVSVNGTLLSAKSVDEETGAITYGFVAPSSDVEVVMVSGSERETDEEASGYASYKYATDDNIKVYSIDPEAKYDSMYFYLVFERTWDHTIDSITWQADGSDEAEELDLDYVSWSGNIGSLDFRAAYDYDTDCYIGGTFTFASKEAKTVSISYENAEGIDNLEDFPTVGIAGEEYYMRSWDIEAKSGYYLDTEDYADVKTADGPVSGADTDGCIDFDIPEKDVTISFHYLTAMPIQVEKDEHVDSVEFKTGAWEDETIDSYIAGKKLYVFVECADGYGVDQVTVNDKVASYNYDEDDGTEWYTCFIDEEATEIKVKVTSCVYYAVSVEEADGGEITFAKGYYGVGATVEGEIETDSAFYAIDEENTKIVDAEGNDVSETVGMEIDGDEFTFTMPAYGVKVVPAFKELDAAHISSVTVDAPEGVVTSWTISGDDSRASVSNETEDVSTKEFIPGEDLSITVYHAAHTDVTIMIDGTEYQPYSADSFYSSFYYIPAGQADFAVTIKAVSQTALTYSVWDDTGVEGLDYDFAVYDEDTWEYNEVDSLEGKLYKGDKFTVTVNGEAPEGYVYKVEVIYTDGEDAGVAVSTNWDGSYTVEGNFKIVISVIEGCTYYTDFADNDDINFAFFEGIDDGWGGTEYVYYGEGSELESGKTYMFTISCISEKAYVLTVKNGESTTTYSFDGENSVSYQEITVAGTIHFSVAEAE